MSVEEDKVNSPQDQQADEAAKDNETAEELVEEGLEIYEQETEQAGDQNWQLQAEKLAEEVASLKDAAVRAQAETQNIRRRAEMDVEKAHKFALEKFAKELLPVIDSLEKAIEAEKAAENETTALREGVEMTLSMLLGGVQKFGLEQVDPVGTKFDPALHEAMSMVDAPDAESNTVIAAMQKAYTLNGRLVRPAMVVVAK